MILYVQFPNEMHKRQKRQKTANKIVTETIFSDDLSQYCNALFLKEKMLKEKAARCRAAPTHSFTINDAIR
jgi:hypothetical protein